MAQNRAKSNNYKAEFSKSERGKDIQKYSKIKQRYGLAKEEYDDLITKASGKCRICDRMFSTGNKLVVDHCHATGKVRGIICNRYNLALGCVEESISTLNNMIGYLEERDKYE